MHKNAYFNYISVLYRSKSFWHLFTELDCRKQKGILASWYIIELPDPLNSAHMNVEMLITGEQRGLIWRGLLFAGSCFSLSNKTMTKFSWILSGYNLIIAALHHNKAEEKKKALYRLHQKHYSDYTKNTLGGEADIRIFLTSRGMTVIGRCSFGGRLVILMV